MARYFHGTGRRGPYFEGWYLKCQTRQGRALALIPAFHIDREGRRSASLQVIAENGTWWLAYPDAAFHACEGRFAVQMDQSVWDDTGLCLKVERDDLCLQGRLRGGPFVPLASDIMGPFRFLPGMECSHGVLSMGHPLSGSLTLNGEVLDFTDGTGYIETDRGRSFPSAYLLFYSIDKDIVRLADLLGHSSIDTTRIYTIETGRQHIARLEQVQRLLIT